MNKSTDKKATPNESKEQPTTLQQQLLLIFSPLRKIKIDTLQFDLELASNITEQQHLKLLEVSSFYDKIFSAGNVMVGKFITQSEELKLQKLKIKNLETEIENLKANIK